MSDVYSVTINVYPPNPGEGERAEYEAVMSAFMDFMDTYGDFLEVDVEDWYVETKEIV